MNSEPQERDLSLSLSRDFLVSRWGNDVLALRSTLCRRFSNVGIKSVGQTIHYRVCSLFNICSLNLHRLGWRNFVASTVRQADGPWSRHWVTLAGRF